jgi:hypothetical protein
MCLKAIFILFFFLLLAGLNSQPAEELLDISSSQGTQQQEQKTSSKTTFLKISTNSQVCQIAGGHLYRPLGFVPFFSAALILSDLHAPTCV